MYSKAVIKKKKNLMGPLLSQKLFTCNEENNSLEFAWMHHVAVRVIEMMLIKNK